MADMIDVAHGGSGGDVRGLGTTGDRVSRTEGMDSSAGREARDRQMEVARETS